VAKSAIKDINVEGRIKFGIWRISLVRTSGLNFINILRTAFMLAEPKSVIKTVKPPVFLRTLLGSTSLKAERKYVGEIEPCSAAEILLVNSCLYFFTSLNFFEETGGGAGGIFPRPKKL